MGPLKWDCKYRVESNYLTNRKLGCSFRVASSPAALRWSPKQWGPGDERGANKSNEKESDEQHRGRRINLFAILIDTSTFQELFREEGCEGRWKFVNFPKPFNYWPKWKKLRFKLIPHTNSLWVQHPKRLLFVFLFVCQTAHRTAGVAVGSSIITVQGGCLCGHVKLGHVPNIILPYKMSENTSHKNLRWRRRRWWWWFCFCGS